jgi:arabinan endo-1,5-alpha-L-arabinosidase
MKGFGILRDSDPARLITSLLTALLVTSATFLPFLIQGATASPVVIALPQPEPAPQPGSQSTRDPPLDGYYPEPEQCRGNCSWIHDPSIYYENGTYWRFSTSGNIAIATAPSIGGPWRYQGALLHQGTSISVVNNQDIWVCLVSCPTPFKHMINSIV